MAIQNSRSRKARGKTMESQVEVLSPNGHTEEALPPRTPVFGVEVLMKKREAALAKLNGDKADREYLADQLKQQEDIIKRSEGALINLNQLINELDPTALQRAAQQAQMMQQAQAQGG